MTIRYSDGADAEATIRNILASSGHLRSADAPGLERYASWPVRYHLAPERANLLRPFDFSGLDVLELGAGMGGVSRYLAETAQSLHVVEGTQTRFEALTERLRDRRNWSGVVGNFADMDIEPRFDVACLVGVLEYSEVFLSPPPGRSPFAHCLGRATGGLRDDGVLLVAIENRLGLKYWNGAAEDHSNRLYDGICGYPTAACARTFSRKELKVMLGAQGLGTVEEFFPFPDYKIPCSVLSRSAVDEFPTLAVGLATGRLFENYGSPRVRQFPEWLALESVASAGLLAEMANSFLVLACRDAQSATLHRLLRRVRENGEIAWHYAFNRRYPTVTTFTRHDGHVEVSKTLVRGEEPVFSSDCMSVRWRRIEGERLSPGEQLRLRAARHAYFGETEPLFDLLTGYLAWAIGRWRGADALDGEAVDATFFNATIARPFDVFDLEWVLDGPLRSSWFVLRNVLCLSALRDVLPPVAPFRSLQELYLALCSHLEIQAELSRDLDDEAHFRSLVTHRHAAPAHRRALADVVAAPLGGAVHPRAPSEQERAFLASVPFRRDGRWSRRTRSTAKQSHR